MELVYAAADGAKREAPGADVDSWVTASTGDITQGEQLLPLSGIFLLVFGAHIGHGGAAGDMEFHCIGVQDVGALIRQGGGCRGCGVLREPAGTGVFAGGVVDLDPRLDIVTVGAVLITVTGTFLRKL